MNVASKELAKELYHASNKEWRDTDFGWAHGYFNEDHQLTYTLHLHDKGDHTSCIPAYDLGYLLRKLPLEHRYRKYTGGLKLEYVDLDEKLWEAGYDTDDTEAYANTPEDAACKLAIELIKQKVITP